HRETHSGAAPLHRSSRARSRSVFDSAAMTARQPTTAAGKESVDSRMTTSVRPSARGARKCAAIDSYLAEAGPAKDQPCVVGKAAIFRTMVIIPRPVAL